MPRLQSSAALALILAMEAAGESEPTVAELQTMIESLKNEHEAAMSHMWLILCGALVMFMHAGFAMLEAGCCRAGFTQSVLEKNLLNCCVSTFGWWSLGWAFAYGGVPENGVIGGQTEYFTMGFNTYNEDGTIVAFQDGAA